MSAKKDGNVDTDANVCSSGFADLQGNKHRTMSDGGTNTRDMAVEVPVIPRALSLPR